MISTVEVANPAIRIPEPRSRFFDDLYIFSADPTDVEIDFSRNAQELYAKVAGVRGDILDIGCGTGIISHAMATRTKRQVKAIDSNPNAVRVASSFYGSQPNLEFIREDAYQIGRHIKNISLVTMYNSLHEFNDLEGILEQVHKVLVPNGIVFIQDFDREKAANNMNLLNLNLDDLTDIYESHKRRDERRTVNLLRAKRLLLDTSILPYFSFLAAYTQREVLDALEKNGFKTESVEMKEPNNIHYGIFGKKC